ncbi:MAG: VOC family protein [Pseudomonadota bacterium]|nr:VOC family protein [Pseudomonadota bacterium]
MIGYVTVGTNNLEKAAAFYDALLGTVGAGRAFATEKLIMWSTGAGVPGICVTLPFDGKVATVGNGVMVALAMKNREQVDAFYNKAIELGATDEGALGERFPGFYAGYFRDPDGNKLNAFFMG